MTTYFLVDGQETDVGLFHGEEEHERAAGVADARGAATAVHEGAANTGRGRGHVTAWAGPGAAGRPARSWLYRSLALNQKGWHVANQAGSRKADNELESF